MKTNLEDETSFTNILNFNYKFRDINQAGVSLDGYDNITLQTDMFSDTKQISEFISSITGSNIEASKLDINTERFFTYSYVCVDQEAWNNTNSFDSIKHEFIKYANILPADNSRNYEDERLEVFTKWKYAKIAVTKQAMVLFASSADMNNYTILPDEYENQYLYTYILGLYKKIYLKKIEHELKSEKTVKKARKKFIEFTKNLWIQEVTEDEVGTLLNHKIIKTFELEKIFGEVKNKYDVLYKEMNIEKDRTLTIVMGVILVISLILNILNFIALQKGY